MLTICPLASRYSENVEKTEDIAFLNITQQQINVKKKTARFPEPVCTIAANRGQQGRTPRSVPNQEPEKEENSLRSQGARHRVQSKLQPGEAEQQPEKLPQLNGLPRPNTPEKR
ncbi:MAG: hypothetical protein V1800_11040 [Candidatus Latescibacterota bacterium]